MLPPGSIGTYGRKIPYKQYVNEEVILVIKKTIVMTMLFAFVLGLTSANAATIKAIKVQGIFR